MELPVGIEGGNYDVPFYCRHLKTDTTLCMVCLTDETEDGKQWDRNQLKCGHIFHSRCLRRWCGKKNEINCTVCGFMGGEDCKYCFGCEEFGHHPNTPRCKVYCDIYGIEPPSKKPKTSKTSRKAPSKR